jgi:ATP-dependent RNA helicase DHX29
MSVGSVIIDRKIKYKIPPMAQVALKILRRQISLLLSESFGNLASTDKHRSSWQEVALKVLGKVDWEPKDKPDILLSR